jgi:predicted RNase H-like nuclease (RuvC/YqgF family)
VRISEKEEAMTIDSINTVYEEIGPEVELLNQTCLDLVGEIEKLKKENTRLKKKVRRRKGSARL